VLQKKILWTNHIFGINIKILWIQSNSLEAKNYYYFDKTLLVKCVFINIYHFKINTLGKIFFVKEKKFF
jgi:hypothetical protein